VRTTSTTPISHSHISAMVQSQIPLTFPGLPYATDTPWSAEIVEAHNGLTSAFRTSRAALNLDESDPIRLGHHLKQAETFMVSIVEVLGHQTTSANTLPQEYIETISGVVSSLVLGLKLALTEATAAFVNFFETYQASSLISCIIGSIQKFPTSRQ